VAGLIRDRSAAEEVTAVAFERAWSRRRQIDPERGSARAWLFGIARNAALDEMRRRSRLAALPEEPEAGPSEAGTGEVAIRRADLRRAFGTLSGRERELVALKYFAGLSNAEIAEVIGTSESNAGTKLHRTIEKLRRACDDAA
jgi:RNA polymerase sigma-70 factor (ECF subfamily)